MITKQLTRTYKIHILLLIKTLSYECFSLRSLKLSTKTYIITYLLIIASTQ